MPCGGTRSVNGSCGLGRCACTALITSSVSCGPVTASTLGCADFTTSSFAPRQPVTITLPFSASASPIALERFLHRGVDEAAGVDDDEVRAVVVRRGGVALGAQLREDALRVDQRLGAAEGDEADLRGLTHYLASDSGLPWGCAGKPGKEKPENMLRAWFCIWSWNCRTSSGSAPCRPASGSASPAPAGS